ncbi:EAL domain-containing protein [Pseudomaricurvus alkylphenolicus]|uniref:putative bifunctional diguanylate cyclase/phosphodiesterase n=1 Tax=Pseudomaricurvus alkylphenolicus TaxID=1306991 RepID=UPI00141F0F4D|nr:EAL domain-containing protein [Pseudomaricurvus alkylphenolicus]NIB42627.1 EAL domain-containing protein [Pseudomaricurvus alkylphenolicus]
MKLLSRVNVILLPVMILVISAMGIMADQLISRVLRDEIGDRAEQELLFLHRQYDQEIRNLESVFTEVVSSQELISLAVEDSDVYRAMVLESGVRRLLDRLLRKHKLQNIQLLDSNYKVVASMPIKDPFISPDLTVENRSFLNDQEDGFHNSEPMHIHLRVLPSLDGHQFRYQMAASFSPILLEKDISNNPLATRYGLIFTGNLKIFEDSMPRLKKLLGNSVNLKIKPSETAPDDVRVVEVESEEDLNFSLINAPYLSSITVSNKDIDLNLATFRATIALVCFIMITAAYFVLRFMLEKQILLPIRNLVEKINLDYSSKNLQLERLESDNEVAELNNAYFELFNDMQKLASTDALTGLENRRSFHRRLEKAIERCLRDNQRVALLYIDLDNFKLVNDHYGHSVGDKVLQQFSRDLEGIIRPGDMSGTISDSWLSRLAGDEFVVMLQDIKKPEIAVLVCQRILSLFVQGYEVEGVKHGLHASIGIAISPEDGEDEHTLLQNADAAMYHAKAQGKNCYEFFTSDIADQIHQKYHIERQLKKALESENLELNFMPVYDTSLRMISAEVLLRCPPLTQQGIGPDKFIPIAESTGLIKEIDLWVIEKSLQYLSMLKKEHGYKGYLAVNISGVELSNREFLLRVEELINGYDISPGDLEFEITETALAEGGGERESVLGRLKELGISLALDDFGTGYTAFNQLIHYPVDCLKIDRSFVEAISTGSAKSDAMIEIILALADLYQLQVVAEGVETEEQLNHLKELNGNTLVQGYLLSPPVSWSEFTKLYQDQHTVNME